jgi:hypothetical protein
MSPVGEAWNCPHCGQRILRSAVNCPACQRRLRFDAGVAASAAAATSCPLRVDGTIHHPPTERAWEYSVLVQVRDSQGVIVARHVVGVGAVHPGDTRTFTLQVEMRGPEEPVHAPATARLPQPERGKQATPQRSQQASATPLESSSPAKPSKRPQ